MRVITALLVILAVHTVLAVVQYRFEREARALVMSQSCQLRMVAAASRERFVACAYVDAEDLDAMPARGAVLRLLLSLLHAAIRFLFAAVFYLKVASPIAYRLHAVTLELRDGNVYVPLGGMLRSMMRAVDKGTTPFLWRISIVLQLFLCTVLGFLAILAIRESHFALPFVSQTSIATLHLLTTVVPFAIVQGKLHRLLEMSATWVGHPSAAGAVMASISPTYVPQPLCNTWFPSFSWRTVYLFTSGIIGTAILSLAVFKHHDFLMTTKDDL